MGDNKNLYTTHPETIVVYSTTWCPDCRRSRAYMTSKKIDFLDVDIGKDNEAFMFVEKLTRRVRIPTIVFPDGTFLIEPTDDELGQKLGLK